MNKRRKMTATIAMLLAAYVPGIDAMAQQGPRPDSSRTVCTQQYEPVCARRGDRRATFGNSCEARRAGYRVEYPGECRREGRRPGRQQFCTREYAPVCATGRGGRQTFGNACEAEAAGYRVIRRGRC